MERSVKVDFLNFTTRRSLSEIISLFSYLPNPLVHNEKGMYGYSFQMSSPDGVMVLFSAGRSDIHIQLTGRGCDLELWKLIELVDVKDHVTRLDIAIDCLGSGFTCDEIWRSLQRGSFTSVSSSIRQVQGLLSRGGKEAVLAEVQSRWAGAMVPNSQLARTRSNAGHTIYVGSPSSDRMVRIYDKGAESETGADWLRFEIQLRRESANQFFLSGVKGEDFCNSALAMLNRQIRLFADGQHDKIKNRNYDRCQLHPFWAALTDNLKPLFLKIFKPVKTVRNAMRYVKNAGSSIKMLSSVMDDFKEFFDSIVTDSILKPHHIAIMDDYMGFGRSRHDEYDSYLYECVSN